jgi:phosphohistidine phosphatase
MAGHLCHEGIRPALVLCSSATRARETLEGVAPGGNVRIEPELYGASAPALLERLQRVPDAIGSVMLVGHNPAIQMLTVGLAAGGDDLARVERKFPTGALATLAFTGAWHELRPGGAKLVSFVRPKELG